MSRRHPRRRWAAAAIVTTLALTSCTTIPSSSSPQVVRVVDVGPSQEPQAGPPRDAAAPTIVEGFLGANLSNDPNHNQARLYLTSEEKNRWSDDTITVVDHPVVGNLVDGDKVTVTAHELGTIDDTGVYTPKPRGDGTGLGGAAVTQTYGMRKDKGQWRIDSLQNGLLVSESDFQNFQPRALYFFDVSQEHLVPDPRYTQITDPHDLAAWLIAGLAQGPRGGLQTGLPNQADPKSVSVNTEDPALAKIEIPGAAQLDADNRDRLAAQLARTLSAVALLDRLQITDGGQPVRIPATGTDTFSAADVADEFTVTKPQPAVYYVRDGGVYDGDGTAMPGKVGAGAYTLDSVALKPQTDASGLMVAGVRGTGKQRVLYYGTPTQLTQVSSAKLHGRLTRPAWAPDATEIWVGSGSKLYRVSQTGLVRVVQVDAVGGKPSSNYVAVRLSPDGSRIALVLRSGSTSQIYVGLIVRSGAHVRVANLTPISPQGIAIRDVAWNDDLKLFAIGTNIVTTTWGLYEVQSDGSLWTLRSSSGLPQAPDSLTVASGAVAVVSAGVTVWRQLAGPSWEGLVLDVTLGSNPVYVE